MRREEKRRRRLNKRRIVFVILAITTFLLACFQSYKFIIFNSGWIPYQSLLKNDGWTARSKNEYVKTDSGVEKIIKFDFEGKKAIKNGYEFSIAGSRDFPLLGPVMMNSDFEKVTNLSVKNILGQVSSEPVDKSKSNWLGKNQIVAHAGGGVEQDGEMTFYTNSLEALKQNYSKGIRVFELDFYLTSDKKLAVVHDWEQFGNEDGVPLTSEEWRNFKTFGSPKTNSRFTTMFIGDVLDQMLINKDMVVVTDTKSFEISEEDLLTQFKEIKDEALKRDPKLLERVVPQIYNEEMLSKIKSIYDFKTVIYTTYAAPYTADEILKFSREHDEIKAVTFPKTDPRFDGKKIKLIQDSGLLAYTHPISTVEEYKLQKQRGVEGFYSGVLRPEDLD